MRPPAGRYDVVIVGASVAGVSAADGLRRFGYAGSIALVDAERHQPYDKPPLSKKLLAADWHPDQASLRSRSHFADSGIDLLLGDPATALDSADLAVTLASGTRIAGRRIVIATGARPRTLPTAQSGSAGTLRTLDDALSLRGRLSPDDRVVIVGGGFIGAEFAAAATVFGARATVLEATSTPLSAAVGELVGGAMVAAHRRRGVQFEVGSPVAAVESTAGGATVSLVDGRRLPADAVVIGLGVSPATGWLAGSGLMLDDGVVCDARGRTSAPHVFAAGDVAAWYDPRTDTAVRSEHWTAAREQGTAVARTIAGATDRAPVGAVPYFWSDQFDLRLQAFGWPSGRDDAELAWGSFDEERFVVRYTRQGRLVGVLGVNAARQLRTHYDELTAPTMESASSPSVPRR